MTFEIRILQKKKSSNPNKSVLGFSILTDILNGDAGQSVKYIVKRKCL